MVNKIFLIVSPCGGKARREWGLGSTWFVPNIGKGRRVRIKYKTFELITSNCRMKD
ncbi:MAG: hypothetical protein PHG64_00950 [Paludibacter sp.]|nr:hypothetical protein [Paludibacter sp.]